MEALGDFFLYFATLFYIKPPPDPNLPLGHDLNNQCSIDEPLQLAPFDH